MDPVSIVGLASSTPALLKTILEVCSGLQTTLRDIKSIDATTEGLVGEVDAFHLILNTFQKELQTSKLIPEIHRWWDAAQLDGLLTNAKNTLLRLDAIAKEVGKQRSVVSALRQYWRAKGYDQEVQHLRLRIGTMITALRIPIELGRIHNIRQDLASWNSHIQDVQKDASSQQQMDSLAVQFLGDRVVQLEMSIHTLSRNLESFQDQGATVPIPSNIRKESEQLINIAHTLAQSTAETSTQMSDDTSVPTHSNLEIENHDHSSVISGDEIGYASSLYGVRIGPQVGQRISAWISAISSSTTTPTVQHVSDTFSDMSLDLENAPSQFTAPSTVKRSPNIQAQLAQARLKKAQGFMAAENYREAIPLFKRSIEKLRSDADIFNHELTERSLQLNLAKAMIKCLNWSDAQPVLLSVLDHSECSPEERSEATHTLAYLLSETDGSRLEEAKDLCESAASIRAEVFGQDDPKTHQSFALNALICRKLHDPDEKLWFDMLPDYYGVPSNKKQTLNTSFRAGEGTKVNAAMVSTSDGNLVVLMYSSQVVAGAGTPVYRVDRWNIPPNGAAWEEKLETAQGSVVLQQVLQEPHSIAISPDGDQLAVGCRTLDSEAQLRLRSSRSSIPMICRRWVVDGAALAFSNNETFFLSFPHKYSRLMSYKKDHAGIIQMEQLKFFPSMTNIEAMAFSSTRERVALAGGTNNHETAVSYSDLRFNSLWTFRMHVDKLTRMAFSPDDRLLAVTDHSKAAINFLGVESTGELLRKIEFYPHIIQDMLFLSNGKVLRVAGLQDERSIYLQEFKIDF